MSHANVSRRRLLATLGLTGASSLMSLRPRAAQAATAPKRFAIYYTYFGNMPRFWTPQGGNETEFELHGILEPLKPYKKDLILLEGLDMRSREFGQNPGNAHEQGQNQALAATEPVSNQLAGGPTIDQVIAQANQGKTRFPSLELGINDGLNFPSYHYISHSARGQKMPSEPNPMKVWDRVFKEFDPSGVPGPGIDTNKQRHRSVLDFVMEEIKAKQPKLSAEDRKKLDAHTASIRDLEVRLGLANLAGGGAAAGPNAGCKAPVRANAAGFDQIADMQARLMAMAFACDLTRVVSYNVEELNGRVAGISGDVHGLNHDTSEDNGPRRNDLGAVMTMKKYYDVLARVFKGVLDRLAEVPDFDGKRVLDNTVVLWCGEIAQGSHSYYDLRWLTAGSAGGALRTGRWIKFDRPAGKGPAHNDLFVSLANAVDVPITKFGNQACTGKLARL